MALSDIDSSLVTVGQPTDGGCVWVGFDVTSYPSDATTGMSTFTGFDSAGDISENGFTVTKSVTSNKFKDWGGKTVLTSYSDQEETFKTEFIEINRPVVAKLKYGKDNVTANTDGSVASITAGDTNLQTVCLVIDELESNGFLRRTVVPKASIDSFDDETHQKGSLLTYGMTFTALANDDGATYYIYRAKSSNSVPTV